jgi:DNA-binding GntR family transcriptional regulator
MNERPIPEAALEDEDSVEMLRVWIAAKKLHCSMKVGMYRETTKIPEEKAWGMILADAARHVANALESGYGVDAKTALHKIRASFINELGNPTSDAEGEFVKRH